MASEVTWAGVRVDDAIARLVDDAAIAHGLPPNVLRAIVLAESGGRPDAVGDSGASIGLLQLHERGQGAGMTAAQRKDPATNLRVGVPPIAKAWRDNAGLSGSDRMRRTAAESGHPGDPQAFAAGSYPRGVAERGVASIVSWWQKLEGEQPSASGVQFAGIVPIVPAERVTGAFDTALAYVREHPREAAVAGLGIAAAALLL